MTTALSLLALTLLFGLAASRILEIGPISLGRRTSLRKAAIRFVRDLVSLLRKVNLGRGIRRHPRQAGSLLRKDRGGNPGTETISPGGRGERSGAEAARGRRAAAHSFGRAAAATRDFSNADALVEWPVLSRTETSKAAASSKLLLVIVVFGVGMAVLTVVLLQWVGLLLQQASA